MGIYGMGKAFNLRYANSGQYRPRQVSFGRPRPMIFGGNYSVTENTNVTIKNGPTGFWGFMSGIFGGLFGGGLSGATGMFGGMGLGGSWGSPYGMLNTQMSPVAQQPTVDKLGNLKAMYSKYSVIDNGNGTYTITKGEGDAVKTGTYDELIKGLDKKPEPQGVKKEEDPKAEEKKAADPSDDGAGKKPADTDRDGWSSVTKDDIKGLKGNMAVNDFGDGGGRAINGNTVISSELNDKGFPKTIKVKGYTYEFNGLEKDGSAIYKSQQGNGDTYRLEKKDGSFALNQHESDRGTLDGVGRKDISD